MTKKALLSLCLPLKSSFTSSKLRFWSLRKPKNSSFYSNLIIDSNRIKSQGDIAEHVGRLCKFELAFTDVVTESAFHGLPIVSLTIKNRFVQIVLEGDSVEMRDKLNALSPAVMDEMPLDFEETFIHDVRKEGMLK